MYVPKVSTIERLHCIPTSYPPQSLALFFVGTMGSAMVCFATPYTPETLPMKIGAFTVFTSVMGVTLAPLIMAAGQVGEWGDGVVACQTVAE